MINLHAISERTGQTPTEAMKEILENHFQDHDYTCTACLHLIHKACKKTCLWCRTKCRCEICNTDEQITLADIMDDAP